MSDFWSKAAGGGSATQAPAPVQQTSRPWWDVITPAPTQPLPVEQAPVTAPLKARSAQQTERCPSCGCGNYFKPEGMPNAMKQCYECGYNPRFEQTASGISASSDPSAPVRPARQVSTSNNFNPTTIVGKVE